MYTMPASVKRRQTPGGAVNMSWDTYLFFVRSYILFSWPLRFHWVRPLGGSVLVYYSPQYFIIRKVVYHGPECNLRILISHFLHL